MASNKPYRKGQKLLLIGVPAGEASTFAEYNLPLPTLVTVLRKERTPRKKQVFGPNYEYYVRLDALRSPFKPHFPWERNVWYTYTEYLAPLTPLTKALYGLK